MPKPSSNSIIGYLIAVCIGIVVGFRTAPELMIIPYSLLTVLCLYFALQNDAPKMLCVLPYLIYSEMYMRAYVHAVPYLFMPYLYIILFLILILRNSTQVKMYSRAVVFFFFYFIIEFINYTRAYDIDIARGLLVNTIALTLIVIWGSFNFLPSQAVYNILKHVKYASVYLCGIVIARHIIGGVEFTGVSSSETINGMAPVQISGYLGFSCTVFFFTIISGVENRKIIINIVLLTVAAVIMLLSFSRGGLYFLMIMMTLYFLFNRTDVKLYFLLLLLIPLSLLVYFYVYDKTEGLLIERYEEEGTSGRDELVRAGITIFLEEPLAGIGLGNFQTEVARRGLYRQEAGAHNEFIRVGAEDGILGMITYWGFFIALFLEIWKRGKLQREYGVYFLLFFCLISIHNGLKISLQPLLLLLAVSTPSIKQVRLTSKTNAARKLITGSA